MTVAFLIQAHSHPSLTARLVDRLCSGQSRIYLNIDARASIGDFAGLERKDVSFVTDRSPVFWAGFSQVRATLALLRAAHADSANEYFVFLSGVDYPIKPLAEIFRFFEGRTDGYLDYFDPCATRTSKRQFYNRHRKYQFRDSVWSNYHGREGRFFGLLEFAKLTSGCMYLANIMMPRKQPPVKPYNGSSWWMLHRDFVQYILDSTDDHSELVRHYDNTYAPDEMFFQTLLLNSPLSVRVDPYGNNDRADFPRDPQRDHSPGVSLGRGAYRYVDWTRGRGHPATLDMRDFGRLLASECLFARKFHPVTSATLLDALDARIHKKRISVDDPTRRFRRRT
jgi:hypothetical protein